MSSSMCSVCHVPRITALLLLVVGGEETGAENQFFPAFPIRVDGRTLDLAAAVEPLDGAPWDGQDRRGYAAPRVVNTWFVERLPTKCAKWMRVCRPRKTTSCTQ